MTDWDDNRWLPEHDGHPLIGMMWVFLLTVIMVFIVAWVWRQCHG